MWLAVLTCKWDGVIILNSWLLPFFVYITSAYIHTHIKRNDEIQIDHQLKNVPESINKRLSEISSDKESFEKAKGTYQDALNKTDYNYNLTYRKPSPDTKHHQKHHLVQSSVQPKCQNQSWKVLPHLNRQSLSQIKSSAQNSQPEHSQT